MRSTISGRADVRATRVARAGLVGGTDSRCERVGSAGVGEHDDRAAEASARHPCCNRSVRVGEIDQKVELRNRCLEVVAHARLTLVEEPAELGEVFRLERGRRQANTFVFG